MNKYILVSLLSLLYLFSCQKSGIGKEKFELVTFSTEDNGLIEAAFFKASSKKAVIFAHGAVFNKESWYFLTEKFQQQNVSCLSVDFRGYGNSKSGSTNNKMYDILGAITWLKNNGFNDINIIGGSMGGAAVLSALEANQIPIDKVLLLAPAGGPPIKSTEIQKLFVVSKDEGLYNRVMDIYQKSSSPKGIEVYPGNTHAQHLFKTDFAEKLEKLILDFIGAA